MLFKITRKEGVGEEARGVILKISSKNREIFKLVKLSLFGDETLLEKRKHQRLLKSSGKFQRLYPGGLFHLKTTWFSLEELNC